jgi:hypoxanthine-DNA glycosylase
MTVKSSFAAIARADARLLVCGSLPGERSLAQGRYYAHPQNQFWALMSPVVGHDLVPLSYETRLEVLLTARVALWDVVASARREGSTDAAIREMTRNDVAALAESLPELRAVAFNGATAYRHGLRQFGALADRFVLVALPSSSPLHTVGIAAKQPAWTSLRRFLDS